MVRGKLDWILKFDAAENNEHKYDFERMSPIFCFLKKKKSVSRRAKGAVNRAPCPCWETHCWEPFKQQRNSQRSQLRWTKRREGTLFNFRFPRVEAQKRCTYIDFRPVRRVLSYQPRCPFMMCGQMFASPCRFLSFSPTLARQAALSAAVCQAGW